MTAKNRAPDRGRGVHSRAYRLLRARLREAREASGLTQEEVGKYFGRSQPFVSKCESGERRIDPIELWRFARLYKRPITFFLPEED